MYNETMINASDHYTEILAVIIIIFIIIFTCYCHYSIKRNFIKPKNKINPYIINPIQLNISNNNETKQNQAN
jgi:hypothetical protein